MNATLIYDGDCPLCCAAKDWVARHAVYKAFEFVPCQSEQRAERFPEIPKDQCMEAMQLVYPDGRQFSGDAALPHIFRGLRGWRWLARVLAIPPISTFSPYIYRLVARNRQSISALVARKVPESCPVDPSTRVNR